ncbi:MAG: YbaY family lipoprotein [Paracoccaceae bacterium]|jgi:putative lipoprotein
MIRLGTAFRQITTLLALTTGSIALAGETAQVTGSAGYRERIALPPEAVLNVQLLDVSRQDVAATVLSSQQFAMAAVPQDFALNYDPALIDDPMSYSVSATIELNGKVLFRTTSNNPVLTRDAGTSVELLLQKMSAQQTSAIRLDGRWTVFEIAGRAVVSDHAPVVDFSVPGSIGIKGACNSYVGQAEANGSNLTFSEQMAGTLKACVPEWEKLDKDLLTALQNGTRYEQHGDMLVFLNEAGVAQVRMQKLAE